MNDKMREQFEAAFVEEEVRLCGEGFRDSALHMIKQNLFNVHMAWWAWQASRQVVVVELPPVPVEPEEPEFAIDDSHMDAYHAAVRMRDSCVKAIEAQGLKVKA
ncbi:hypothetical protein [Pseudomonas chlororaphis]|uniref:hypothetical protein n=1 Tax=Pseudomonas chlororaphis TaxID=587753 RepID=UPI000F56C647|nr:hypothetical protein [Pseudomonas chlororaphis]AZC96810.1 hypothetical protein C4K28_4090 [Pseudomonas chlororaphis subsp. piscium]